MTHLRGVDLCVTVDLQLESRDLLETTEDNLTGRFSYGRYGAKLGVWRILEMLRTLGIPATFFTPGYDCVKHPEIVEAIVDDGHEIASHGWGFDNPAKNELAELELLSRAHEALTSAVGTPPKGWRTATGVMTSRTLDHLHSLGYLYDSSFQDDDGPYCHTLTEGRLVEIPRNEVLSDSHFYAMHTPHAAVRQAWLEEFDALAAERDGLPCFGLNPRGDIGSGRAARLKVAARFLEHVAQVPGLRFRRCMDVADDVLRSEVSARHLSHTHLRLTGAI